MTTNNKEANSTTNSPRTAAASPSPKPTVRNVLVRVGVGGTLLFGLMAWVVLGVFFSGTPANGWSKEQQETSQVELKPIASEPTSRQDNRDSNNAGQGTATPPVTERLATLEGNVAAMRAQVDELGRTTSRIVQVTSDQTAQAISLMDLGLAVTAIIVALLVIVAGGTTLVSYWESKRVLLEGKEVERIRGEVEQHLLEAKKTNAKITDVYERMKQAWEIVQPSIDQLPKLEQEHLFCVDEPWAVPIETRAAWEDLDPQVVICDRLGLPTRAEYFLQLGNYWRKVGNFTKSLMRLNRARELDPNDFRIYINRGKTLVYSVADDRVMDRQKKPEQTEMQLHEALDMIRTAQRLCGEDNHEVSSSMAWIYDELEDYGSAIPHYWKAIQLEEDEAKRQGRSVRYLDHYNLLCALSKGHKFAEAHDVAKMIIDKEDYASCIQRDPDLRPLLGSDMGDAIRALIKGVLETKKPVG